MFFLSLVWPVLRASFGAWTLLTLLSGRLVQNLCLSSPKVLYCSTWSKKTKDNRLTGRSHDARMRAAARASRTHWKHRRQSRYARIFACMHRSVPRSQCKQPLNPVTCNAVIKMVAVNGDGGCWYCLPPRVADADIIFLSCFFPTFFLSSPNFRGRRMDVYHTSTHDVVLVRI